jgi:hypothetical protein
MTYSYYNTYVNLKDLYSFEVYLYQNGFSVLYTNYSDSQVETVFNTELTQQQETDLTSLITAYTNPMPQLNTDDRVSLYNSTTTPLSANAVFEGVFEDVTDYSAIGVLCISNTSSITDGLELQYSIDGTTKIHSTTWTIKEGFVINEIIPNTIKYVKIKYTNGTSAQSSFCINIVFKKICNPTHGELTIKEEVATGPSTSGRFRSHGIEASIPANSEITKDYCWKYPITALTVKLNCKLENIGDKINMYVMPTRLMDTLTSAYSAGSSTFTVSSTIYPYLSVGYHMAITNNTNTQDIGIIISKNAENHTITTSTVLANDFTIKSRLLWRVPVGVITSTFSTGSYDVSLDTSSYSRVNLGLSCSISNNATFDELGEICSVDETNKIIETSTPAIKNYSAGTPIYFKAHVIKNLTISDDERYTIGESKIGGSYINPYYIVRLVYTNIANTEVSFSWNTEYIY